MSWRIRLGSLDGQPQAPKSEASGGLEMEEARASVQAALDMVAKKLSGLLETARGKGAKAYAEGDSRTFQRVDRQRQALETFHQHFTSLLSEWGKVWRPSRAAGRLRPREGGRAGRGELLPAKEYVFPILRALQAAGGAAPLGEVLAAVEQEIGPRLTGKDRGLLSTGEVRWRNRAAWVRHDLVEAGLLSASSPKGLWEITDLGRQELERGDLEHTWQRLRRAAGRR